MSKTGRPDPFVGQVVGDRYEVIRRIGRGAMGAIYEVRHKRLKRSFALKTLVSHLADDTEALARFQREADAVAQLRHPNIVEITDWETLADGTPCIVMELLLGEDLERRLAARGQLAWPDLARIGDEVVSALLAAHRAGIVHRDLKPQNIFLATDDSGEEHVKLLDFGVSKIRGDGHRTTDDRVIGTPAYMAPEQAEGRVDLTSPAADVWAVGAMLFEMATGREPFAATSAMSVLYRIVHGDPEPLAPLRPDAPAAFIDLVGQALSRDPARRITDAETLRRRLRESLGPVNVFPATPTPSNLAPTRPLDLLPPATPRFSTSTLSRATGERKLARRERPRVAWFAGVAALLLFATGIAFWVGARRGPALPDRAVSANAQPPRAAAAVATPAPVVTTPAPVSPAPSVETIPDEAIPPPTRAVKVIEVRRVPARARLTLDGAVVTGERIEVPADGARHRLRATAPGHRDESAWLDGDSPKRMTISLTPIGRRPAKAPSKPAPAPAPPRGPAPARVATPPSFAPAAPTPSRVDDLRPYPSRPRVRPLDP